MPPETPARPDAASPSAAVRIEDLSRLRRVEQARVSPDGRRVACVLRAIDLEANADETAIFLFDSEGQGGRRLTAGPRDGNPVWSPDGRWIAFERVPAGGRPQIHLIPVDGGEARPVTRLPGGASQALWAPDGRRLAFLSPLDAEERAREDRDETEQESGPDEARHDPRVIDRLPYRSGTRYLDRESHVYVLDLTPSLDEGIAAPGSPGAEESPRPRRITGGEGSYAISRWSPDGAWIFGWGLIDYEANDRFGAGEVLAFPAGGGRPRRLSPPGERVGMPLPSPCGRYLAWPAAPADRTFSIGDYLALRSAESLARSLPDSPEAEARDAASEPHVAVELPLLATSIALDRVLAGFEWAPDGSALILACPDRGAVRLLRFDAAAAIAAGDTIGLDLDETAWTSPRDRLEVPYVSALAPFDAPDRYVTSFDLAGETLAVTVATPEHPAELYGLTVGRDGRPAPAAEPRQLTRVNAAYLASRELATSEEIWFEAPDGHAIQAWLLRPPATEDGAPAPLVLEIHGGPHAMWGPAEPTMWHELQCLVARGYGVFYCNPRGSDGYGRRHRMAIHRNWGFAEERDFLSGLDVALRRGGLDGQRIGVTGGSYGGYMTAWLVARHDRFRAAVSQRGVYDLHSFAGTSDIPRFTEQIFETAFWEEPERLWRHSPLAYLAGIEVPLLILHAERDFRAPIGGAEQLFAGLKRLGRPVRMVRYPREGHELSRSGEPKHRIDRLQRITDWFDAHL